MRSGVIAGKHYDVMSNTSRHILSDDSRGVSCVLCTVSQKRRNSDEGLGARAK